MSYTDLDAVAALVVEAGLDLAATELIIDEAVDEDLGGRGVLPTGVGKGVDVTSVATIDPDATATGQFVARAAGTVAGIPVAAYTMARVLAPAGPFVIDVRRKDGERVVRGDVLIEVSGNARALLTAERIALNLITMMSGVATATRDWVDALAGTGTRVRDSRKTVPGLRMLQKYAVRTGGGVNHRMSLADQALIKDNHVIAAGGVVEAFNAVRQAFGDIVIQVEVTTAEQARAVISAGADDVLLDNMTPAMMAEIVSEHKGRARFEASGGLTVDSAAVVAASGVDFVAVGGITHSARIMDIALDLLT